jgi:bifunctional UDP-N-acetylglucosamine pyrophosphorylase/glucosamine-1-phosphate N-acetyltransferase
MKSNIQPIILAAGKGTRMNQGRPSLIPKALYPLRGKPMVAYILKTLAKIGLKKPILVVGYKGELVEKEFGKNCDYVYQRKRLGTGHAARLAINFVSVSQRSPSALVGDVLILQGDDSAFYQPETLKKFILNHEKNQAILSFLATIIPKVKDFGRVIRNNQNEVVDILEKDELNKEQEKIEEVNCGGYLVDFNWLKTNIKKLKKTYKGKEYPLPDIIKIALSQGRKVIAYKIDRSQWIGINSPDQLQQAETAKN